MSETRSFLSSRENCCFAPFKYVLIPVAAVDTERQGGQSVGFSKGEIRKRQFQTAFHTIGI
jgi:hypothetical protein